MSFCHLRELIRSGVYSEMTALRAHKNKEEIGRKNVTDVIILIEVKNFLKIHLAQEKLTSILPRREIPFKLRKRRLIAAVGR